MSPQLSWIRQKFGFQQILDEGEENVFYHQFDRLFVYLAFVSDIRQIRVLKLSHSPFNLLGNWIKSVLNSFQDSLFDAFSFDEKTTLLSLSQVQGY